MSDELPIYLAELTPKFLESIKAYNKDKRVKSPKMCEGLTKMVQTRYPNKTINSTHIRMIVRHLRRKGYPICSSSAGYWWARTFDEWQEGLEYLRNKALDEIKTYNIAKRSLINENLFNL